MTRPIGTGGFLTDAMNHVGDYGNRDKIPPVLVPHGQELEPETHAVCVAGMLIRRLESSLTRDREEHSSGRHISNDQFAGERFHYHLSNPPFSEEMGEGQNRRRSGTQKGEAGPVWAEPAEISDGSMLFLMHWRAS
jgi:type I restriction enzyme M protein